MYQTSYTLNLHNVMYQLDLNLKKERKVGEKQLKRVNTSFSSANEFPWWDKGGGGWNSEKKLRWKLELSVW